MIAGAPLSYWIGFHVLVAVLLAVDVFILDRKRRPLSFRGAVLWTLFLFLLALAFAGFLFVTRGHESALEFFSGYIIEGSLSIDNLFVFLLLFRSFALNETAQRHALHWGVLGAIVLRAAFIVAGVALLEHFRSVEYIFGAILLYAAFRLMRQKERNAEKPPAFVSWFGFRKGRSPLVLAIVAIELTDLIFAIDSIPAVLAVTHDTFLAYTSNIFAILGLRSLFFVLSGLLSRLRALHYGLALVLGFVGMKMLLARWLEIPVGISLLIILGILAVFTVVSLRSRAPRERVRA